jgi:putative Mg2+ transporter-C (MgtC) family protein
MQVIAKSLSALPGWWPISGAASSSMVRLLVATGLGGAIGLERELKHRPAGLRTNIMICFGAAMFTLLSDRLAGPDVADRTRIAAQIITGIGFIGAGTILHEKGSVSGLTSAATIFVTAGVGMAAGGGLFQTALFATLLVVLTLIILGEFERRFDLKQLVVAYDVISKPCDTPEPLLAEVNQILDDQRLAMQTVRVAKSEGGACHLQFSAEGYRSQQKALIEKLRMSPNTATVAATIESERD